MLQKIRTAYSQLADFFVCHFMSSFRSTVMSIFVPLIVAFVVLTAAVSERQGNGFSTLQKSYGGAS